MAVEITPSTGWTPIAPYQRRWHAAALHASGRFVLTAELYAVLGRPTRVQVLRNGSRDVLALGAVQDGSEDGHKVGLIGANGNLPSINLGLSDITGWNWGLR